MPTEKQIESWERKKGKSPWNKGIKLTEEHKKKLSLAHKGKPWTEKQRQNIPPNLARGIRNNKWKGDKASYYAIHIWISNHFGKSSDHPCSICHKTGNSHQMQWASLDHKYSRDIKDWRVMCVKCHCQYDKNNLGTKRGGDHCSKEYKKINTIT